MVMAGGTGGHVFPALAVAEYLREQGESVIWMGTRSGIEARLVPAANFPIEWLEVQGIRGKGWRSLLLAPLKIVQACWQAMTILRRNRPRAVLGMGGFAAGPGGLVAWLMRIPLVIHEQNAVIGMTNRLLKRFARASLFAFPRAAQGVSGSRVVGNPVRREILALGDPAERLEQHAQQRLRLLVVGGSLGARQLNRVVPAAIELLDADARPEVRHQCGEVHIDACRELYRQKEVEAEVLPFIEDMSAAYEWADIVICRAGALTVAELAAAGMASILVPFPHAVDDHQFHNARYLESQGAAIIVRDEQIDGDWLAQTITTLDQDRSRIVEMATRAYQLASRDATEQVASTVLQEALS
jgi:UDP-N-acetylglucosamine--N-acetylmuramyl-(pentapeptide) pyrophosphoryl-undecaprenol N-acetylglucosamine transferase